MRYKALETINITYIPKAIIILILLSFSYLFICDNRGNVRERIKNLFLYKKWILAFLLYSTLLVMGTIFERDLVNPYSNIFHFYGFVIDGNINEDAIKNLLIFMPFSYLFIMSFNPQRPFRTTFFLSLTVSSCIELLQLIFWLGFFQLEDIIYNSISGIIGCALWYLVNGVSKKYKLLIGRKGTLSQSGKLDQ